MRGSGIRAAISAAIEAITPDTGAGFTAVDPSESQAVSNAPDRGFVVGLDRASERDRTKSRTGNVRLAAFEVVVFYHAAPGLHDRISDDAERIDAAINALDTAMDPDNPANRLYPDLRAIKCDPEGWSPGTQGRIGIHYGVEATYLLTGV